LTVKKIFLGWVTLDKYKQNAFITWKDNNSSFRVDKTIPYFENRKRLSTIAKNMLKKELNTFSVKELKNYK
jgi:hypothetical protein